MNNVITMIKIRKGSKRIPNKNILEIGGKPLYMHTIEHAKQLGFPILFLTDYEGMRPAWVNTLVYPDKFGQDKHKLNEALIWALKDRKTYPDYIIYLQVTSPKRDIEKCKEWVSNFIDSGKYDVGFAAKPMPNVLYYDECFNPLNYSIEDRDYNSSQMKKKRLYAETGSFYIFKIAQLNKKHILDGKRIIFEDPFDIDIDFKKDFDKAKAEYEN